jgi:hypothetical protein
MKSMSKTSGSPGSEPSWRTSVKMHKGLSGRIGSCLGSICAWAGPGGAVRACPTLRAYLQL